MGSQRLQKPPWDMRKYNWINNDQYLTILGVPLGARSPGSAQALLKNSRIKNKVCKVDNNNKAAQLATRNRLVGNAARARHAQRLQTNDENFTVPLFIH